MCQALPSSSSTTTCVATPGGRLRGQELRKLKRQAHLDIFIMCADELKHRKCGGGIHPWKKWKQARLLAEIAEHAKQPGVDRVVVRREAYEPQGGKLIQLETRTMGFSAKWTCAAVSLARGLAWALALGSRLRKRQLGECQEGVEGCFHAWTATHRSEMPGAQQACRG